MYWKDETEDGVSCFLKGNWQEITVSPIVCLSELVHKLSLKYSSFFF